MAMVFVLGFSVRIFFCPLVRFFSRVLFRSSFRSGIFHVLKYTADGRVERRKLIDYANRPNGFVN